MTIEFESIQVMAGFASTAIFASSKVPMLAKALRTRDLSSYSIGHIGMSVSGNLIYWLYVLGLPLGPIWVLQAFFTVADILMLACYICFELRNRAPSPKRVEKVESTTGSLPGRWRWPSRMSRMQRPQASHQGVIN